MTSIAFGGGPPLQQRRDFAGLKFGTHVPGYRGYCPQIKYKVGRTYGDDTHKLALTKDHRLPADPTGPEVRNEAADRLPDATGDNRYTKEMVPGYTGYIPRKIYKYGHRYKEECDYCIDEFLNKGQRNGQKLEDLQRSVRSHSKLDPLRFDPLIREELNRYRDTHPSRPVLLEDKRALTEPPMPGYHGYIPRIYTTEAGLGTRYNRMTKNGLEMFAKETSKDSEIRTLPVNTQSLPVSEMPGYARRMYLTDGMIPKYTGYCPQRRFVFGNTYGDTTRSLNVCKHQEPSFGDYTVKVNQSL